MPATDLSLSSVQLHFTFQDVIPAIYRVVDAHLLCQFLCTLPQVHNPLKVHFRTRVFLRGEWTLCRGLSWLQHMVSHPESGKKAPLSVARSSFPTHFMASYRSQGAKQTERNKWPECGLWNSKACILTLYLTVGGRNGRKQMWMKIVFRYSCEPLQVYIFFLRCECMCLLVVCVVTVRVRWTQAPLCTGSPWLALTRSADHINATTHLFHSPSSTPLLLPSALSTFPARHHKPTAEPWDTPEHWEGLGRAGRGLPCTQSPFAHSVPLYNL